MRWGIKRGACELQDAAAGESSHCTSLAAWASSPEQQWKKTDPICVSWHTWASPHSDLYITHPTYTKLNHHHHHYHKWDWSTLSSYYMTIYTNCASEWWAKCSFILVLHIKVINLLLIAITSMFIIQKRCALHFLINGHQTDPELECKKLRCAFYSKKITYSFIL